MFATSPGLGYASLCQLAMSNMDSVGMISKRNDMQRCHYMLGL